MPYESHIKPPKVFCIGFHKTGTTSLDAALNRLGYRVTGPNGNKDPGIEKSVYQMAYGLAHEYDAFRDNPWPILFREMDARFPNSKFILTTRPREAWIASMNKHFGQTDTPMREWIYGVGHPAGNEAIYLDRFDRHHREVREHFKDRPNDLLEMDLATGAGWPELCTFLDIAIPDKPFPVAGTANSRRRKRLRERLKFW